MNSSQVAKLMPYFPLPTLLNLLLAITTFLNGRTYLAIEVKGGKNIWLTCFNCITNLVRLIQTSLFLLLLNREKVEIKQLT